MSELHLNMKYTVVNLALLLITSCSGVHTQYIPINYVVNPYRFCRRAMENPNFHGGDMILPDLVNRFGKLNASMLWPNKRIPYEFDWNFPWHYKERIVSAMKHIESGTCIRFEERTNEDDYVRIIRGRGCYSSVGYQDIGEHILSLGVGCDHRGIMLHEMMHVLGCFHEHERPDRDKYIRIMWHNIEPEFHKQFRRIPRKYYDPVTDFDYYSIMMYGAMAFSDERQERRVTIVPKRSNVLLVDVWHKAGLTERDFYKLNKMYDCNQLYK